MTKLERVSASFGRGAALTGIVLVGLITPAAAVDAPAIADTDKGEIIVTARHRTERAQDVPIALSVVDRASIQARGDYSLNQLQQAVPVLQTISINPRNTNINIRGLGANSAVANDGLENGVGIYVDNVYYARPGQSQFDLIDLDRVEVLRGPQGTLFGKNTTAGAVNITTRLPSFTPELEAEATIGDRGYYQLRATGSGALIADKVAARLSIGQTSRDGFIRNDRLGRKLHDYHNFNVRGQLLVTPTDSLTIRLIADYARQRQECCVQVPQRVVTTFANGAVVPNNFLDRVARAGYVLPPIDAFARRSDTDSKIQANMSAGGLSGEVNLDLGEVALTSVTAYRRWNWNPQNDGDLIGLPINVRGAVANRQRQFSQELRLASTSGGTIDWQVGAYYFWQVIRGAGVFEYGSAAPIWNRPPASPLSLGLWNVALNGFTAQSRSDPETHSVALFGQSTWHVTDALSLTGGLRYTHEKKTGSFTQVQTGGLSLAGLSAAEAAAVLGIRNGFNPVTVYTARQKDDSLSALLTLSYQVSPGVLGYATYARGNKSGGLNLANLPAGISPLVDAETVDSYELGLKTQFLDNALTFNLAAFSTQIRDFQSSIAELATLTTSRTYLANIPKVRSRGFEADIRWAVTDGIALSGGIALADAKYVSYRNAPAPFELSNQNAGIADISGRPLPGVSKWAATFGADARQAIGRDVEVYGRADLSYRSASYSATVVNDSIYARIPAYSIVNARIGLRGDDGRWDVSVWTRNLFDKDYYVTKTVQGNGLVGALLGDPRTIGLTLRGRL